MKTAKKLSIWLWALIFGAGLIGNVPVIPAHATTVYVTPTGSKYHTHKCGRGSFYTDSLENAKARGLTACSKCFPNGAPSTSSSSSRKSTTTTSKTTTTSRTKTKSMTVSPSSIVLLPGQSKQLKVKSASGTVTYKSSNTGVAKVDARGKITAKKKGKATITISSSNGKKSCKVKVEQIKLNQTSMDLTVDDEELSYDFITVKGCSHTPTYRSTDEEVVSVDEAGNVEAEGEGKATIIVRVHGKTLKCKVRVEEASYDDEEPFSDYENEDEDEDYYGY